LPDRRITLDWNNLVLDVGGGANPHGNIQIDLKPEISDKHHRWKSVPPTVYADAHHLPFRDSVFNRVLCLHIIEHLTCPFHALLEVRRVLKHKGTLRIEVPNPKEWNHERKEHLYSWHPDTLQNIVRETNFRLVKYHSGGRNHSVECMKVESNNQTGTIEDS